MQKQSSCLPCMAAAVSSLQWLPKTRLRQVLCIISMVLAPSAVILSRWVERGAALSHSNEFVCCHHAVVDLNAQALRHPWFHTCVINTVKKIPVVFRLFGISGLNFLSGFSSAKIKAKERAMLTLTFHVTFKGTVAILDAGL